MKGKNMKGWKRGGGGAQINEKRKRKRKLSKERRENSYEEKISENLKEISESQW